MADPSPEVVRVRSQSAYFVPIQMFVFEHFHPPQDFEQKGTQRLQLN